MGTPKRAEGEERELLLLVGEHRSMEEESGEIGEEDAKPLVLCFTDLIKYCCCKNDSC